MGDRHEQLGLVGVMQFEEFLLAQAKLGAIQNEISAAVNTYIDDPKALTIAAAPANPIAFPMIMGAAMGAPETIPGLIGLKVTAND